MAVLPTSTSCVLLSHGFHPKLHACRLDDRHLAGNVEQQLGEHLWSSVWATLEHDIEIRSPQSRSPHHERDVDLPGPIM